MIRRLFVLLPLCLFVLPVVAQDALIRELDQSIEQARVRWGVPGLAVAIVKDNEVLLSRGYGVREAGKSQRVDENTLFAIASNTKAFTAALLAGLVDDGILGWNDPVQKYLPWFELYDPYVSADVRVKDLLSHRVGLGTFSGDLIWYGTSYSREEVVRRARYLPQAFPFRAGYGYSNIMYIAAGEVIENASSKSWESLLRERILAPLSMDNTVLSVKDLKHRDNVATPHAEVDGKSRPYPWYAWDNVVPAGGIISCISDLSSWLKLVINRGTWNGTTAYSDAQSRTMWTPQATFTVSERGRERNPYTNFSGYGLGWSLNDYHGNLMVSHGGGYDGMFSQTVILPDRKIGVVVLTNSMTAIAGAITSTVVDAILGTKEKDWFAEGFERLQRSRENIGKRKASDDSLRVGGTEPTFPLASYSGLYGGPMYGDATVTVEDGKLVLRLLPNPDLVADLSHWHYDVFKIDWRTDVTWFGNGKAQFLMNERGDVVEMKLNVPNDDFWFHELEFKKKKGE
jgi:CubicO group peptidase (beta-lactamase class C family)